MRILMLIEMVAREAGGAERFALGLAAELAKRDHEVVMCETRASSPEDLASLERAGVRVFSLGRRSRLQLWSFRPLWKLLREEEFDVLHAHMFGSNVWGVVFGRLARVPVVIAQEQTWSYEGEPVRKLIDGAIGRLATRFVAVSSADQARMISTEHVPAEKTEMIPNAYVPRPDGDQGDLRAELGLRPEVPVVGTAAVLRPQKALQVLLRAFAMLGASHPDARLVIGGDGPCRGELEDLARELGIAERTHFLGTREDIETVLAGFDVATMSSDFEGTPLFAVECMANGTPLVATDVGGLSDLVENERSALLVPRRDPEALAAGIERLLSDPALRKRLAEAAKPRAAELSIERITDRFVSLYESLLAAAR